MLTPGEFVVNRKSVNEHFHTLKAINDGTYRDTSKELIAQHIETNKQLAIMNEQFGTMNERLISLENAELRRKINITADIKGDPNGIVKTMKFQNYKRSLV